MGAGRLSRFVMSCRLAPCCLLGKCGAGARPHAGRSGGAGSTGGAAARATCAPAAPCCLPAAPPAGPLLCCLPAMAPLLPPARSCHSCCRSVCSSVFLRPSSICAVLNSADMLTSRTHRCCSRPAHCVCAKKQTQRTVCRQVRAHPLTISAGDLKCAWAGEHACMRWHGVKAAQKGEGAPHLFLQLLYLGGRSLQSLLLHGHCVLQLHMHGGGKQTWCVSGAGGRPAVHAHQCCMQHAGEHRPCGRQTALCVTCAPTSSICSFCRRPVTSSSPSNPAYRASTSGYSPAQQITRLR